MRLPDFSSDLPTPGAAQDPVEQGRLLLRYLSARQPVQGLDFSKATLRGADLRGADLSGAVLVDANLHGADLRGTNLSGTDLERASMEQINAIEADLRNARLVGAHLGSARLGGADLRFADLQRARLQYAVLQQADLGHADLRGANLQRARLRQARLGGADLRSADLRWADLLLADLTGAHIDARGIQLSDWSGPTLAALQERGLCLSEQAPTRPQATAAPEDGGEAGAREGLLLRLAAAPSPLAAAVVAVAVGAWRARSAAHTAALDASRLPLVVTAADPDELEALALLLRERRWEDIDLRATLQPAAIEQLVAMIEARQGFELWVRKSGGVRKVLTW